jgi:osmoprotectant transport system permease protein
MGPARADERGDCVTFVNETVAWLTDPAHWSGPDGIPGRLVEHVEMSLLVMLIAIAIALPIGLVIGHTRRGTSVAVGLANIGRAVPTFAMMGILLPFTQALDPANGFGLYPTLLAMIILAIPPILVNTYAGVSEVDRDLVEAARGMGFRAGQILRDIEIPLALPVILGGIRSAAVQVIATTTLGAILGIGGLGRFIVDGIAQNDDGMLFGGVVLVAGLAMLSELLLSRVQRLSHSSGRGRSTPRPFLRVAEAPRQDAAF